MKVKFITFDGKEYNSPFRARKHELKKKKDVIMFDELGRVTEYAGSCLVVCLHGASAAKTLMDIHEEQCVVMAGIEEGDEGMFVWDNFDLSFKRIDESTMRPLITALLTYNE